MTANASAPAPKDSSAEKVAGKVGGRDAVASAAAAFRRAFETVTEEVDDVPLRIVEGALPADLRGVLFRNGPGRVERGGERYGHLFDGDGMVVRFEFSGGEGGQGASVRYRNRYVRTAEYVEETKAGRILYRGFGTASEVFVWGRVLANNPPDVPARRAPRMWCAN